MKGMSQEGCDVEGGWVVELCEKCARYRRSWSEADADDDEERKKVAVEGKMGSYRYLISNNL